MLYLSTTTPQRDFLNEISIRFLLRLYFIRFKQLSSIKTKVIAVRLTNLEDDIIDISGIKLTKELVPYSTSSIFSYFLLQTLNESSNFFLKKRILNKNTTLIKRGVNNLVGYSYSVASSRPDNKSSRGNLIYWGFCGIFLNLFSYKNIVTNVIRVTKIFNKGRYSRNRQTYRTGVY